MGGGGGFGFSPTDKSQLEQKAKEKIEQAGNMKTRNVFISFSHEDMNEVNLLRGQSKNDNSDLEFSDYSVKKAFDSEDSDYIKRKIREKIKNTSVTMVYLSDKSIKSKWVKWEVEQSIKMGKGVIAVHKGNTPPANTPSYISDNVSSTVQWNHDAIMAAVNKASMVR
ncbi:MAG: TIR domain-containing protein [Gammaproteobacteria bacterium]|nr:TIR domain-containing protein [Gammaproteobacteria bacterium]